MRERNRRQLCRWLFLLFGFLPTCGVMGYIFAQRLPDVRAAERQSWEQLARRELGLRLAIGLTSQPLIGVTAWRNARLLEAESGIPLAEIGHLEIVENAGELQLAADQIDIFEGQLGEFVRELHERFLRLPAASRPMAVFVADRILIRQGNDDLTLAQVRGRFGGEDSSSTLELQFQVAGETVSPECLLLVRRNRQIVPAVTELELEVGSPGISTAAFAGLVPLAGMMGHDSRFQGNLRLTMSRTGYDGLFAGRFSDVNCDDLVTAWLPHKLSGRAEIVVQRARFQHGRIVEAAGSIQGRDGVVGSSLLRSLADFLPLQLGPAVKQAEQPLWPYDRFAVGFELNPQGLSLKGQCDGYGALAIAGGTPLLTTRTAPPAIPLALVRALAPENEIQAPASHQTEALIRWLPLPAIVPSNVARGNPVFRGVTPR